MSQSLKLGHLRQFKYREIPFYFSGTFKENKNWFVESGVKLKYLPYARETTFGSSRYILPVFTVTAVTLLSHAAKNKSKAIELKKSRILQVVENF